jgi:membrane-bound lytic murein transglycosylase D
MKKFPLLYIFLLTLGTTLNAQLSFKKDSLAAQKPKITYLDSIKKTFVVYKNAKRIDSLWMKDMASLNIYDQLITDIKNIDVDQKVDYELSTDLLKERLKKMDEKSPFNIEYNIGLENVIKSFLKNRKRSFERLMGLSQFYFPLFEQELAKNNIPLEIKYLAVVESALNTRAISRVGATGLWQFMYQTGKQYGLKINSFIDERNEPMASSKAASQYMNNMFKIFNDWDLVLAAYNSGPGNVAKAIRRSGGQQNYWNIRRNLPKETQGYLPAFLATMYIFEYHKEHGIVPNKAVANHFSTDTIMIKKAMTFKQISQLLDISTEELQFFNPSFKRNEIPYISGEPTFLTLPKDKIAIFTSNEDKIYAYIENEYNKRERPNDLNIAYKRKDSVSNITQLLDTTNIVSRIKKYKVQKGDDLADIANKYDVTVWQIKKWNHLKSNKVKVGKSLIIISSEKVADQTTDQNQLKLQDKKVLQTADNSIEANAQKTFVSETTFVNKEFTKYHKVKKGETLGEISEKYNIALSDLKKCNNLKKNNVTAGQRLKIITTQRVAVTVKKPTKLLITKTDTLASATNGTNSSKINNSLAANQKYYTVEQGDNLNVIATKHNVTVANLIEWNNLKNNQIAQGSQLIITTEDTSDENHKKSNTNVHLVGKGDNLQNIALKYKTSQVKIKVWNKLINNALQIGQELIISDPAITTTANFETKNKKRLGSDNYLVQKGDSLYSISKKFPGITIADLKIWNELKDEGIKPGMKLKISG